MPALRRTSAPAAEVDKVHGFWESAAFRQMPDNEKGPRILLPIPLPDWICDKEVAKLFLSDSTLVHGMRQIPQLVPIDSCVGPAVWWAWARAIVLWTQVIVTTWGFVFLKIRLVWVWPLFSLAVMFGLGADFMCVRHFIVPWVQQAHGCVTPLLSLVFPDAGRSFRVWMPLSITASIISTMSIQFNALFVARTWQRQWLDDTQGEQKTALWNEVMDKSMFGTLLCWIGLSGPRSSPSSCSGSSPSLSSWSLW